MKELDHRTMDRMPRLGQKTCRMKKMARLGLFVFFDCRKNAPATAKPPAPKPAPLKPTMATLFFEKGALSVREAKNRQSEQQQPVSRVDGKPMPASAEGWVLSIPVDPEMQCVGVQCLRMSDGSCVKYYRVLMTKKALKRRKNKLKRVTKQIDRAINKQAKREVREFLWLIGKR